MNVQDVTAFAVEVAMFRVSFDIEFVRPVGSMAYESERLWRARELVMQLEEDLRDLGVLRAGFHVNDVTDEL